MLDIGPATFIGLATGLIDLFKYLLEITVLYRYQQTPYDNSESLGLEKCAYLYNNILDTVDPGLFYDNDL